ncbi:hypothetical protein M9H77_02262 [Catharanthus roseus]|uniref:Uncharacterized protein n=1 Tax=Catharanthus roseus TaxID=4058 RepID=A0ACC0C7V4_CATRO|nr:hypothetical protein M9H77_02262 [Catharanthus roseus]
MTHKTNKDLQTIISTVKGVKIIRDKECLAYILGIPENENTVTIDFNRKSIDEDLDWNFDATCSHLEIWPRAINRRRIIYGEDRMPGHNPTGFCSIKKTTQTGLGASSSQPVEDDDEADESYNPSDDEEDEAST